MKTEPVKCYCVMILVNLLADGKLAVSVGELEVFELELKKKKRRNRCHPDPIFGQLSSCSILDAW